MPDDEPPAEDARREPPSAGRAGPPRRRPRPGPRADPRLRPLHPGAAAHAKRGRRGSPAPARRVAGAHPDDRDPQLLDTTVGRLVDDHGWELDLRVHGVFGRWAELVGAEVAAHCTPESFDDGRLVVRTDSTAWATQLKLLAPTVVRRLNEELGHGTVTVIEVLGPHGPSWKKGPARSATAAARATPTAEPVTADLTGLADVLGPHRHPCAAAARAGYGPLSGTSLSTDPPAGGAGAWIAGLRGVSWRLGRDLSGATRAMPAQAPPDHGRALPDPKSKRCA